MLVQRIALERFGRLDQQAYTFRPGLNLVKGPNEAGKTTLQEALLFALLGNPRHMTLERVKSVDDHVSWGENQRFSITLDIVDSNGTSHRLRKDWDQGTACLTDLQTGEREEDIDAVQRAIGEMLGHGSLKLLQSTVCVEQDAIDELSTGRREIGDQLQSMVTGGGPEEATVSTVLEDLERKIAEMRRGWRTAAPKNPGPIKVRQDQIAELEQRLFQMRPQVEQAEQARERLIALGHRIEEIGAELDARRSLKELYDQCLEWEDRRSTWRDREKELEAGIARIEKAQRHIDEAGVIEKSPASRFPLPPLVGAGVGGLLFLIGLVVGVPGLLRTSDPTLAVVGVLVGLPGLLICVGSLIWLAMAHRRSSPPDVTAPRAQLDALLGEQTLETLIEQRKAASRHRRDAEEALASAEMRRAAAVTPLESEKLQRDIGRLETALEEKRHERTRCETRRDDATYTVEDVHRLEERKAAAERELGRLRQRLRVYKLTLEVIQQAKEQTMNSARGELEPRIGAYLDDITRGRYDRVAADEDLNLRVFSRDKGDWIAPGDDELSRGTVDQLYLATRLALLDLLYPDASPPVLMDDPFVKFDPQRRERAVALCREIAQAHQVLLFTCHDHYDSAADWIVELTPPS